MSTVIAVIVRFGRGETNDGGACDRTFVEEPNITVQDLKDRFLKSSHYMTKTRGFLPPPASSFPRLTSSTNEFQRTHRLSGRAHRRRRIRTRQAPE